MRERPMFDDEIHGADQKITALQTVCLRRIYKPRINKSDYGLSTADVQVKCSLAGISSTRERFTRGS